MKAEAIAIKSRMKNRAYEAKGNFFGVYPNLTVYFLSFAPDYQSISVVEVKEGTNKNLPYVLLTSLNR